VGYSNNRCNYRGQADGNTDHRVAAVGVTGSPQHETGNNETSPAQRGE
jgi:hypothetical protein